MTGKPPLHLSGFRVRWDHVNGRDRCLGDFWENRTDAEYIAETLRASGWCRNVEIVRAREVVDAS